MEKERIKQISKQFALTTGKTISALVAGIAISTVCSDRLNPNYQTPGLDQITLKPTIDIAMRKNDIYLVCTSQKVIGPNELPLDNAVIVSHGDITSIKRLDTNGQPLIPDHLVKTTDLNDKASRITLSIDGKEAASSTLPITGIALPADSFDSKRDNMATCTVDTTNGRSFSTKKTIPKP